MHQISHNKNSISHVYLSPPARMLWFSSDSWFIDIKYCYAFKIVWVKINAPKADVQALLCKLHLGKIHEKWNIPLNTNSHAYAIVYFTSYRWAIMWMIFCIIMRRISVEKERTESLLNAAMAGKWMKTKLTVMCSDNVGRLNGNTFTSLLSCFFSWNWLEGNKVCAQTQNYLKL